MAQQKNFYKQIIRVLTPMAIAFAILQVLFTCAAISLLFLGIVGEATNPDLGLSHELLIKLLFIVIGIVSIVLAILSAKIFKYIDECIEFCRKSQKEIAHQKDIQSKRRELITRIEALHLK